MGGRSVGRIGLGLAGLRTTGMWGEPARRAAAVNTIRRAVELGIDLIEVPGPFGPWVDLVREAEPEGAVLAVRLTAAPAGGRRGRAAEELQAVVGRLGRHLRGSIAAVLAELPAVEDLREAGVEHLGVVVGARPPASASLLGDVAAVRGPWPAPRRVLEWCEQQGVPYLCSSARILDAGAHTVALLEPSGRAEIDRLYREAATPPAAAPG